MSGTGGDRDKLVRLRRPRRCPECGAPADRRFWPFCSRRCADVDLDRWLSGHYRIPGAEGGVPSGRHDGGSREDTEE